MTGLDSLNSLGKGYFHLFVVQTSCCRSNNVEGTRNLLEASIEAGVHCFVHGSTTGFYWVEINEASPLNPDHIYGVTGSTGPFLQRKMPRQKNTWVVFGTGNAPSA
jgi:hypothetical protein